MYEHNLAIRFQRVAVENAGSIALWFGPEETINYSELNKLSNRMARQLLHKGVRQHDVICIFGSKSIITFATLIACMKLGAPYCVLDPDSPAERLRKILATCTPRLILGEQALLD